MERWAETLVQALLPARCLLCHCSLPLASTGGVCGACWNSVSEEGGDKCHLCGEPSQISPCVFCSTSPPPWEGLQAVFSYEPPARDLVLYLKNGFDQLAQPLAARLWARLRQVRWPAPLTVTFVPMKWWRLVRRGYNQAALLARELARYAQWDLEPLLVCTARGSQKGLSRSARRARMTHAFKAKKPVPPRVLLVDDVVTTGATAAACCRALRRGGAEEVWVATVAKTPRRS